MAKINLDDFTREVLVKGPRAVLPRNLSNRWLNLLARQAYNFKHVQVGKYDIEALCASVILLVLTKKNVKELQMSIDELDDYIAQYCTELELEAMHRNTEFSVCAVTLETIFTNRKVEITKRHT